MRDDKVWAAHKDKGLMDLLAEASLEAIEDAGAGDRDFDAVYVANFAAGELTHQTAIASALVDQLSLLAAQKNMCMVGH
ncbi:MAG: hypothetical protein LWX08_14255 [Deltaproteobacteria bacterium]|jgi:3-oxoacyl-[acyl-carrier-protein] synthase III|nr:hypothetical protein [Deltaproteobacteria bacterium]